MTQNILEHNLNSTVVVIMLKVASSSALFLARDVRIVCISMFPPPIPLWGSYPIPLGKQLLSSPQFSHSILGHSEKGLWSKHFITRQWNIVDLCSRTRIILLSKCVAPDTRTVSEPQNLVFPLRCSIIFPFVWAMWNGVLCNEFFTDFCRAN